MKNDILYDRTKTLWLNMPHLSRAQFKVLCSLAFFPRPMALAQIIERTGMSESTVLDALFYPLKMGLVKSADGKMFSYCDDPIPSCWTGFEKIMEESKSRAKV